MDVTIPNEILLALIPIIVGPITVLWRAWQAAESECKTERGARAADAKAQSDLLVEQRIANVGALATITMREFERDTHKERADRCERENERLKEQNTQRRDT